MITDLTFTQLRDKLKNKEFSSLQILRAFKDEYENVDVFGVRLGL